MRAWLYSFDGMGNYEQIVMVSSDGTPGQSTAGSGLGTFSHEVDNLNESLLLRIGYSGATDDSLRVCGIRIRYQYSAIMGLNFLPLINK